MAPPGVFTVAQKAFLKERLEGYDKAYKGGFKSEYVAETARLYFLLFDIRKGIKYEPTQEEMDAVDRDGAFPELVEPARKPDQTAKEYKKEMRQHNKLVKVFEDRLAVRYTSAHYLVTVTVTYSTFHWSRLSNDGCRTITKQW